MEFLRRKRDGDDRIIPLSFLISKNFAGLYLRINYLSEHSQYGDRFYITMIESGGREVDALYNFIQKNSLDRDSFEKIKDQNLITLYCTAYEFLALKRKIKIPFFILDYQNLFLTQVQNNDIKPTRIEKKWLFLIRFRDNFTTHRLPNGKPIHLN
jgi:hypothetical protein